MATLQIENLPDEIYSSIQTLAVENNLTVNEAIVYLLKQAFKPDRVKGNRKLEQESMSEVLKRISSRYRANPSDLGLPDSTILIREDRHR
ncbi:hypothetical protein [Merismopedia glauca]|uniref:CopG-like ribbon-helix-helix domain-containing protein n=1 Tax=Merismopedia glauca CCAP 1448/3 TaxID=1296344 RepID=A0A2T1C169_9CYAN|nr:hypothetical protein [Merismopedia glauca]PSB02016.1 hypothetical protein C7B64_15335 [Merismopedia glauca CCAP 1448/3]